MSVKMTFYSGFSKRENSTKLPSAAGGSSVKEYNYMVTFKEPFSILGGTVRLDIYFDEANLFTAAKYMNSLGNRQYIYKVVDVVSITNKIVEITLTLDVLATYRSSILTYTGLIERAPSEAQINYLPDDTISNTGNIIRNSLLWESDLVLSKSHACVQIKTSNSVSAQCYYTSLAGLKNLTQQLDDELWAGNDIKLITEVNLVNISLASISVAQHAVDAKGKIVIGNVSYNVNTEVYAFYQPSIIESVITYNLSSIAFTYSDARKINSKYTRLSFFINNTEVLLDSIYNNASELTITCTLDLNTLSVLTQVKVKNTVAYKIIYSGYTNVGIGYSLSNDNANNLNGISTAFRMVGQTISQNYAGLISEIPNLIQNKEAACSGSAPGTTLSITDLFFKLYLVEYGSTDKSPTEYSYPYYKVNSINKLSTKTGFFRFKNPSIDIAALQSVRDEINRFLSQGFYYE